MAVLLPNCMLTATVRAHPFTRDARGRAVPSADDAVTTRGPYPGAVRERSDETWRIRADVRVWPLQAGDSLTDGERTWVVLTAQVTQVPGAPDVDHVVVTATLEPPRVR